MYTMAARLYTELDLRKMKGQALKDTWHALIGKPPGLKNTTGLRNSEEIVQAILNAQADPNFRPVKEPDQAEVESMPPKERKKPGPKPKPPPPVVEPPRSPSQVQAVETTELPLTQVEVKRIRLKKLKVGETQYYLEEETLRVYEIQGRTPGEWIGTWDPTTQAVS